MKDYLTKGFVLDDERLKQGNKLFGKDYFQELLERIQAIRASEKMFYEKIKDLYATSVDYDSNDPDTHKFFAKVQNKVEYAIVKKTPAETIRSKANALLPNMNLRTWKNAKRDGNIQKIDVTIAKNYFTEDEIKKLNTLVNMYLDYAKLQVERNKVMKMADWENKLDLFLAFNEFPILTNFGSIKKEVADKFAIDQYNTYKKILSKDQNNDFKNISENINSTGEIPKEESIFKKESLTNFNSKLKAGLNFNSKKNKRPKVKKSQERICPQCGNINEKDAGYCNANIMDDEGNVVSCGYSFGAIDGKDGWF